jgi:hypothetical protein
MDVTLCCWLQSIAERRGVSLSVIREIAVTPGNCVTSFMDWETLDTFSLLIDFDRAPVAWLYPSTWSARDVQLWSLFDQCWHPSVHLPSRHDRNVFVQYCIVVQKGECPDDYNIRQKPKCADACKQRAHFFSVKIEHVAGKNVSIDPAITSVINHSVRRQC